MRQLIAGNWKMNTDRAGAIKLARSIVGRAGMYSAVDLLVCPPFVYLGPVSEVLAKTKVALGASMYHEANGAFTGEISAAMLLDVGCSHVILGHSERRHILGETDELVNKKTLAALAAGSCQSFAWERPWQSVNPAATGSVIRRQFEHSLANVTAEQIERVIIAYEPVWAIGTGKVATPQQAEEVHAELRKLLTQRYNERSASQVRILYGGSVKPGNAADLLTQPNIDGALVGGASLNADDFLGIAAGATSKSNK